MAFILHNRVTNAKYLRLKREYDRGDGMFTVGSRFEMVGCNYCGYDVRDLDSGEMICELDASALNKYFDPDDEAIRKENEDCEHLRKVIEAAGQQ